MQNEDKLIRLLIVDDDPHKAEKITSALRATGIQVRAEFAEDDEDMGELLSKKRFDLVLFSLDLAEFELPTAIKLVEATETPPALIAQTEKFDTDAVVEAMKQGARDTINSAVPDHLIRVIQREAGAIATERKVSRLERQYQESEKRCQSLLTNSKDAVAYVHEGMHVFANQAYIALFGHTTFDDLEGTPLIDMVVDKRKDELKTFLRDLEKHGQTSLDLEMIQADGAALSITLEFAAASYDEEPCTQILIRAPADTSELEERISYLHEHDLVSGLYNRQYFMDELKKAIDQAIQGSAKYALVYIAIDNFQRVRDTVGISGCDVVVGDIANILREQAGERYTIARFGAYAFTCLVGVSELEEAEQFAAGLPPLVEQHICDVGSQSISTTCSAAVVFIDKNSTDNPNQLVMRAERTCEEIQAQGGNGSRTYVLKAGEITQGEEDGITANQIKDALNNNRIKGLYQPVIGIKGQPGERYQSSIEITTAEGQLLPPEEYQTAAERTGTAKMLDRWKILHAIKKITATHKRGRSVDFFIPLSADSLLDPGLPQWVGENIKKAGVNGQQLVFMIDERHLVSQLKAAKELVDELHALRCQITIDEFGTGLNPFQLVKHVGAEYVRFNHGFMQDLVQNEENQESIRELAYRAGDMALKTITPYVDDASMLSVLWSLNVDFIQGDFLQQPQKELNYDFSSV